MHTIIVSEHCVRSVKKQFLRICFHSGILEESVNRLDSSATIKAKLFYKSCMNISE